MRSTFVYSDMIYKMGITCRIFPSSYMCHLVFMVFSVLIKRKCIIYTSVQPSFFSDPHTFILDHKEFSIYLCLNIMPCLLKCNYKSVQYNVFILHEMTKTTRTYSVSG